VGEVSAHPAANGSFAVLIAASTCKPHIWLGAKGRWPKMPYVKTIGDEFCEKCGEKILTPTVWTVHDKFYCRQCAKYLGRSGLAKLRKLPVKHGLQVVGSKSAKTAKALGGAVWRKYKRSKQ